MGMEGRCVYCTIGFPKVADSQFNLVLAMSVLVIKDDPSDCQGRF